MIMVTNRQNFPLKQAAKNMKVHAYSKELLTYI